MSKREYLIVTEPERLKEFGFKKCEYPYSDKKWIHYLHIRENSFDGYKLNRDCEVIGNIFENKELLEGKKYEQL